MIQNFKGCKYQGHYQKQVEIVCKHHDCRLSRLLCSECLKIQNHQHQENTNSHILNQQQLLQVLEKDYGQIIEQDNLFRESLDPFIKQYLNMIEEIKISLKKVQDVIDQYLQNQVMKKVQSCYQNYYSKAKQLNFVQLDDETLKYILNLSSLYSDYDFTNNLEITCKKLLNTTTQFSRRVELLMYQKIQNQQNLKIPDKEKYCIQNNRNNFKIEHICTYPYCSKSRFICSKCLKDNTHEHYQKNNDHIVDQQRFIDIAKWNVNKIKQNQAYYDSEFKKILQQINTLIIEINKQEHKINNNISVLEKYLKNVESQNFSRTDDKTISSLLTYMDIFQEDILSIDLQSIEKLCESILERVNQWSIKFFEEQNKMNEFKNHYLLECQILKFKSLKLRCDYCCPISLSSNSIYLATTHQDERILGIYSISSGQFIKKLDFDNDLSALRFTDDCRFLYASDEKGYLYQLDCINKQFNQTFKMQIHKDVIKTIKCIQNDLILTDSADLSIIKTNIQNRQIIFIIQYPANVSDLLELGYNKNLNVTICFVSRYMFIWDNNCHYKNKLEYWMEQVCYVEQQNSIISFSLGMITVMEISSNYTELVLKNIFKVNLEIYDKISLKSKIIFFSVITQLQQQYIVIATEKQFEIYSIDGKLIQQFNPFQNKQFKNPQIECDNSINQIIVRSKENLFIFKR